MLIGVRRKTDVLTEPEMGPSCADLPLTLKVTPLGAFDLTSRFAGALGQLSTRTGTGGEAYLLWCGRSLCSRAVKIGISKSAALSFSFPCRAPWCFTYIIGRLAVVAKRNRDRNDRHIGSRDGGVDEARDRLEEAEAEALVWL